MPTALITIASFVFLQTTYSIIADPSSSMVWLCEEYQEPERSQCILDVKLLYKQADEGKINFEDIAKNLPESISSMDGLNWDQAPIDELNSLDSPTKDPIEFQSEWDKDTSVPTLEY